MANKSRKLQIINTHIFQFNTTNIKYELLPNAYAVF